jgi:hypothetical protein
MKTTSNMVNTVESLPLGPLNPFFENYREGCGEEEEV